MKTRKLGIAPTLVVTVLVLGFALLIGVILLMMYIRTGIEHSPEQASIASFSRGAAMPEADSFSTLCGGCRLT
jgi:hypothetical protein